ncbi:hypothetical protein INT45_010427 [Circinella minor]|uniref:Uncharacterized protein n=1 Tax=Circinella minor TaxID=1195481 RepID=A0A8H7VE16_9FUNG|nr:hypothetical protein INT45_010427 [Circinella minor]
MNYLSGNGIPSVVLKEHCDQWIINTTPITERFLKFRNETMEHAKEGVLKTYQEELALNCIFLIDGVECAPNSRLHYGFDEEEWDCMLKEVNDLYPMKSLADDVIFSIVQFAQADKQESSFSIASVYPIFLPFIDETELVTCCGTDGQAQGSAERRDSVDGNKSTSRYSDLSMNFSFDSMPEQGLLIVEIKPFEKVKNGSRPDFIKLANEMKDAIDKMVKDGMDDENITVLGVLIEGFKCTLFVMDLMYQATTYRLVLLSVFYIPRDRHDLYVLLSSYEALATMRKMTYSNARRCYAFYKEKKRTTIRHDYTVESFRNTEPSKNKHHSNVL